MIDFSHPEWRALAQQLLARPSVSIRSRQMQPLLGLLQEQQWLLALGQHHYELTPAGRRYLSQALALAAAPQDPEEWLHSQGWQLRERVNERVLAALYRKGEASFTQPELRNFEDKGIRPCPDGLLRLRAARPFSLFFGDGTLLDAAPWLQCLGEVALPERTLSGLGKILWGEGEIRHLISTDSVGAFSELALPDNALLVWAPSGDPDTLSALIAALPPQVHWSHLTALDPAGVDRMLALARRLGRPPSWWLPLALAPIVGAYATALADGPPWAPSRLPRSLLTLCRDLIEADLGLSAEACALAPDWHAVG